MNYVYLKFHKRNLNTSQKHMLYWIYSISIYFVEDSRKDICIQYLNKALKAAGFFGYTFIYCTNVLLEVENKIYTYSVHLTQTLVVQGPVVY